MPTHWMISDRNVLDGAFGVDPAPLSYWLSEGGPLDQFGNWSRVEAGEFKRLLIAAADQFPTLEHAQHEQQSHVTFLIHGYNVGWADSARRYEKLCADLFSGPDSLGLCVSFDWPSLGSVVDYYPDREHAVSCAGDLVEILSQLYDWMLFKQQSAITDPQQACKAKVSVIVHSMGNFLLQKAMASAWTRKHQPLFASLVNQLVMVAADVDNNLFEPGADDASDGNAVANLTHRVTSLYSGRDAVLGVSAGLKHSGVRRLGRSGFAARPPGGKDNVWEVDCSGFFPASVEGMEIHSAYFGPYGTIPLIRDILTGLDRNVLETLGRTKGTLWP